ncbi:MAG: DNA double-strand break repair nuclease NurA [Pyrinomonadaceae bacterium]
MLSRPHLHDALNKERGKFARFERAWRDRMQMAAKDLRDLGKQSADEIRRSLSGIKAPGAIPSAELDTTKSFAVSFDARWRSHEEARAWATDVLRGRVTFAADGSQMLPGREISLPVAAVQVAGFENPHTSDGQSYRKEIKFEIITPEDFISADEHTSAVEIVNWRRFKLEIETVGEFLINHKDWRAQAERMPLAFFDGTLLISYSMPRNARQKEYIAESVKLINLSRETGVPLVGFIDQSFARDLTKLVEIHRAQQAQLQFDDDSPSRSNFYDAQLLRAEVDDATSPLFEHWGDRTIFCYCLRPGLVDDFRDEKDSAGDDSRDTIAGFVYLQTTGDGAPARLDVPTWIYDADLIDEVVDTVRAECVVGNGYPYAIETADATAVLSTRDREPFLRAVQDFAAREQLPFGIARKSVSKGRRR